MNKGATNVSTSAEMMTTMVLKMAQQLSGARVQASKPQIEKAAKAAEAKLDEAAEKMKAATAAAKTTIAETKDAAAAAAASALMTRTKSAMTQINSAKAAMAKVIGV